MTALASSTPEALGWRRVFDRSDPEKALAQAGGRSQTR